jgi:hypoxanthine phosphoribosyltransferase
VAKARILIPAREIAVRTQILGEEIQAHYARHGKKLNRVVIVLKGAAMFAHELLTHLNHDLRISYITARSYANAQTSSGNVELEGMFAIRPGEHVLIIEDIVDTGNTIRAIVDKLLEQQPASLKVISLLDKPARRDVDNVDVNPDWYGFRIEDVFVYGHGLDLAEQYRGAPDVMVLEG